MSCDHPKYQKFLGDYVEWCKAAIADADRQNFAALRRLGGSFPSFVFAFLEANQALQATHFFQASLARLLRINASPPDDFPLQLCEQPAEFWAEFEATARAKFRIPDGHVINVRELFAGRKPGRQVLKSVGQRLKREGLHPERQDSRTTMLITEAGQLSVTHCFSYDDSGFLFFSGLRLPSDRLPRLRTSYAGHLGLTVLTHVALTNTENVEFATSLATEWRAAFDCFIRTWSAREESPNPSLQRTPPG